MGALGPPGGPRDHFLRYFGSILMVFRRMFNGFWLDFGWALKGFCKDFGNVFGAISGVLLMFTASRLLPDWTLNYTGECC